MNEDKATRYHRLRRRVQVLSLALVGTALATAVAQDAGRPLAAAAVHLARSLTDQPFWGRMLAVAVAVALLAAALEILALPGACILGFVLERRYGLSRQSLAEWVRDHVKATVLGLLMAVAVALVIYGAMAVSPAWWWLWAGLVIAGLASLLAVGAPVLLLPLFYKLEPIVDGELSQRLTRLAERVGAPILGVYEWSLGEKSRAANAALVGLGPTRRILLSDTLIAQYTPDEIEVIIAHELAHHVHGDIWKGILVEAVQGTLALLSAHAALIWFGPALGLAGIGDLTGMPLLVLVAGACSVATAPFILAQSRTHERRADRYAIELTDKADAFVSAMKRLGAQNLADEDPSRVVEWLFHSHPTLQERIAAARRGTPRSTESLEVGT
jgi:STE24 endopeptidase